MNDESLMVLFVGGALVATQVVRSGEWAALWARLANADPGKQGNKQLARDVTGHSNFLYIIGQTGILVILVVIATAEPQVGRAILWLLAALWLVYLVTQTNPDQLNSWLSKFGL